LVEALLKEHGLADSFAFVAGGDTFAERKPDPMAVEFILKRYGVTRDEVIVVGDHSPDIEMAKRAGVSSVYCNYGFFGDDSVGADLCIDALDELPGVLARLTPEDDTLKPQIEPPSHQGH
ncbi:MAG TPA: HAD-IA family hydrolase, partial [Acidobacteriota bacterium]|nr:HAD-IA family hydrolase [Acidobacteriota bacterium]